MPEGLAEAREGCAEGGADGVVCVGGGESKGVCEGPGSVRNLCRAGDGVDFGVRGRRRECGGVVFLGWMGE